ncbi:MAG: signal peptidase II [Rhodoluna sp.]|nr:signal peptidase II [Rhodoluna sp.]
MTKEKAFNKSTLIFLGVAILVIAFDQLTKALALANLELYKPVPVIGEILHFTLAFNDRAAFSLGGASTWVFTLISSLVALGLIWFGPKFKTRGWLILGGLALGGVCGNLIDRLFREPGFPNGHVVDFIQIPFNFPIFNIADSAICIAAFLIALRVVRGQKFGGSK